MFYVLLFFMTLLIGGCSGGGSGGGEINTENKLSELNTSKTTALISGYGGDITVPYDDKFIAGTILKIPNGAIDKEIEFSIQAEPVGISPSSFKEIAQSNSSFYESLVDHAIDNIDSSYIHPIYGPLLMISSASFSGPKIRFSPKNEVFKIPLTASIPFDVVSITADDEVYAMLQSEDGTWEVVSVDKDMSENVINVEIPHFSQVGLAEWLWDTSMEAACDAGSLIWNMNTIIQDVSYANEYILPKDITEQFLNAIVCTNKPLEKNLTNVISEYDLLKSLYDGSVPARQSSSKLNKFC
jgi:hypothetical protein